MKKIILLAHGNTQQSYEAFSRSIKETVGSQEVLDKVAGLKICLTETSPPFLTPIPFLKKQIACLSVWIETNFHDEDIPKNLQIIVDDLRATGRPIDVYQVEESIPRAYEITWRPGQKTPGVGLLTLLNRNPKMGPARFKHEWFGKHTPMTLKIHPVWQYVRNVVQKTLNDTAWPFEGIVEEHFHNKRDLVNIIYLFGGPLCFLQNMIRVGLHIGTFLDLPRIQTYFVNEYWIKMLKDYH